MNRLKRLANLGSQTRKLLSLLREKPWFVEKETIKSGQSNLSENDHFLCVYVFLNRIEGSQAMNLFSADPMEFRALLASRPLFLKAKQAFEYSRFMSDNSAIVKVYTPQSTIICHDQKLTLRRRGLKKAFIRGFHLIEHGMMTYYENPNVNSLRVQPEMASYKQ